MASPPGSLALAPGAPASASRHPGPLRRYADWLHLRWPAGDVERLPVVREDGATNVPGVFVAGDLAGVPLLKLAIDSGVRATRTIAAGLGPRRDGDPALDLAIVGAGVAGVAAAIEARARGLSCEVIEAAEPFATLVDMPAGKPIYAYPTAMTPPGALQIGADIKETLLDELRDQAARAGIAPRAARVERIERGRAGLVVRLAGGEAVAAKRVLIAIGRTGDHRTLGVPGEDAPHVHHRLHDPSAFAGRRAVVVGGGDTAAETAIALARAGAHATLVHRGDALARPKRENREAVAALAEGGRLALRPGARVTEIRPDAVVIAGTGGATASLPADVVFTCVGRDAPLALLRRSGVRVAGDRGPGFWISLTLFLLFCAALYDWKSGGVLAWLSQERGLFPFDLVERFRGAGGALAAAVVDPRTPAGTLAISASSPAFWVTLAYSVAVVVFGLRRIARRRTPYVTLQTWTLIGIQVVPLFLLPELVLPLLGHQGLLPAGLADALFPAASYGHGREYWRAYGFVLAFPLNVYNVFTAEPLWWWIGISVLQTLVLIPLGIHWFGKGFYCGWICSCGALAETLGDTQREKMPHGSGPNRLNLAGQAILALALLLLAVRIAGWALPPGNVAAAIFDRAFKEPYKWTIDVFLAGVVGYGLYFWFSGRVWCRFFCPLAALMHVYARLGRFAIVPEREKCISCGVCTSVCHQGIDVMAFANRGLPMIDPQCVRCSACVSSCPTGVLQFGQVSRDGVVIALDRIAASPVRMREGRSSR